MPLRISGSARVDAPRRDAVDGVMRADREPPTIASLSDIHGYLDAARSALLTLSDRSEFDPIVVADEEGKLHWADENYVLVFNGDLVDRGPSNRAVLELVARLVAEAPPGRVRVTLGNHEAIALSADHFDFSTWYAGRADAEQRRALLEAIAAGHVVAAYRGYNVTYAHAGRPEPYDVDAVNEELIEAAERLRAAVGTLDDVPTQRRVLEDYSRVLGVGERHPKGPGAGLVWLDFDHLPADAPAQVVGHTRHRDPQQKGTVYCQNVIRNNLDSPGGEGVFVETPRTLSALVRRADGGVDVRELERF